jgi:uncharacterized protein YjbI with pentapeptide repeats
MSKLPNSKPLPFSEDLIRAKARELWEARGSTGGTPEEDWKAAIEALQTERSPIRRFGKFACSGAQGFWNWTGFKEKKLWDFLQLLIVPAVLSVGAFYLQNEAKQRETQAAEATKQRESQAADDKAKQDILTKYFDQMADLLLKQKLLQSKQNSEIFIIGQAKAVTALQSLDPARQHLVIQFLEAANLNNLDDKKGLLYKARMSKAKLIGADLSNANLRGTDFSLADLSGANLRGADLRDADLNTTNLHGTDLRDADLRGADLRGADLLGIDLRDADLRGADLGDIDLRDADLRGANLRGTDLRDAKNITIENVQLACFWQEAKFADNLRAKLDNLPPEAQVHCTERD